MPNTPHLDLILPAPGSVGWAEAMNANLLELDAETLQIRQVLGHVLQTAEAYTDAAIAGIVAGQLSELDSGTF